LLLVANPVASRFTGATHRDVTEILSVAFDVATVWPNGPQEACEVASAAAAEGVDVVAAMGGDGIAHRIANAVAGTNTALAVIPAGTTNVLARVIGLTANPRRAAQRIAAGPTIELPTLRVVTRPDERDDIALFSAGVGLDADIVALAEKDPIRKVGFGPVHYARSALSVVVREYARAQPTMRIAAPGRRADAVGLFVQLHDRYTDVARLPMRLTPTRGAGLTALVVQRVTAPIAGRVLARGLTRRDLRRLPGVEVWQGIAGLTVDADPPARCQADGELLGTADRIEMSPSNRRLLVIASP
jgi:diacylglycerol kinase family enzyme